MNIYVLKWQPTEYGQITGAVVQSMSEEDARQLVSSAASEQGNKGYRRWLDEDVTDCEEVGEAHEDEEKILMVQVNDG